MELSKQIARDLLAIQAVQIRTDKEQYFTWTSGIQSPIYCDNRLTMSYPEVRKRIVQGFVTQLKALQIEPDVVAGCATAGIPHAAWLAEALDVPMVYVRSKPKGHGKGNQIEGEIKAGQKVVVIEDLISTGGSALEAATVLQEEGAVVQAVLAIFTYGLNKAKANFSEKEIPFYTLTSFDYLVDLLVEEGQMTDEARNELINWRNELSKE